MSGADEEWVKAAMSDDAMVVELLVRLQRSPPKKDASRLRWSGRQRRSKSVSINAKKPASPTTPLAWSGGGGAASFSGGCGSGGVGCEESSRPIPNAVRSKTTINNEKVITKKSRKKKTLAELKDEESSLIKERRELKRELSELLKNLEIQRATNENLKRLKIELQPGLVTEAMSLAPVEEESTSGQLEPQPTSHSPPPYNEQSRISSAHASDSKVALPDLNIPFDEPLGLS